MLAPERRTRADIISAVAIVVLVVVAALVVWARGDATGTESVTAPSPPPTPPTAGTLPVSLRELWHAPDGASTRALASGGAVITGEDGTVTGRDPATGAELWRYRRDMPLCGVESQYGSVVAVYRDQRGCSQATLLDGDTGERRTARSSYMDENVRLSVDGTYVLAKGERRLEMWRSDLVRTIEYGYVDAAINVKTQPRKGCTLLSAGSSASRLAVLERCPDDQSDRLTLLNPAPKDNTVPEEYGSRVLTGPGADSPGARVIAVSENRVVVYLPGGSGSGAEESAPPRLAVFDATGNPVVTHHLSAPLDDVIDVSRVGSTYFLFTGNSVIALNASTFDPMWTAADALGAPALMAGRLLLPVTDGMVALDPANGQEVARIPVRRSTAPEGPISVAVLGSTVLERRDGELFALG